MVTVGDIKEFEYFRCEMPICSSIRDDIWCSADLEIILAFLASWAIQPKLSAKVREFSTLSSEFTMLYLGYWFQNSVELSRQLRFHDRNYFLLSFIDRNFIICNKCAGICPKNCNSRQKVHEFSQLFLIRDKSAWFLSNNFCQPK